MSKKRHKKSSGKHTLEKIVLATAALDCLKSIIEFIKSLTN